jgi:hypothetical protein
MRIIVSSLLMSQAVAHFGPIIKKAISWTEAVKYCSKSGGTIAIIDNELDLSHYQAAIGYKDFENMVRPRVWIGKKD